MSGCATRLVLFHVVIENVGHLRAIPSVGRYRRSRQIILETHRSYSPEQVFDIIVLKIRLTFFSLYCVVTFVFVTSIYFGYLNPACSDRLLLVIQLSRIK